MFIVSFHNVPFFSFFTSVSYHIVLSSLLLFHKNIPRDDSVCIYPASVTTVTQTYIKRNLTYIRHVWHPEVLTEIQNVIMSPIVIAASHMINCVVDSLHYTKGGPQGEEEQHKRLQIPSRIYYPIKLPSSPSPPRQTPHQHHLPSTINMNVNQVVKAQAQC